MAHLQLRHSKTAKYLLSSILAFTFCYCLYYSICYGLLKLIGVGVCYNIHGLNLLCESAPDGRTELLHQLALIRYTEISVQCAFLCCGAILLKTTHKDGSILTGGLLLFVPFFHSIRTGTDTLNRLLYELSPEVITTLGLQIASIALGVYYYRKYVYKRTHQLHLFALTPLAWGASYLVWFHLFMPLIYLYQ